VGGPIRQALTSPAASAAAAAFLARKNPALSGPNLAIAACKNEEGHIYKCEERQGAPEFEG